MTQFEKDLDKTISFNGKDMPVGIYNLIISKRDVGLWCIGMKPHRFWKFTDVKNYFGLKGNKEQVKEQIVAMVEKFVPKK